MLTIKVTDPVVAERRFDVYELEVENMSGDADAYETSRLYFKNNEKDLLRLEQFLVLLDEFSNIPSGYQNDSGYDEDMHKTMQEKFGISPSHCSDMLSDTIGYDVTCEGMWASLSSYSVFYWDTNGNKYETEYELS